MNGFWNGCRRLAALTLVAGLGACEPRDLATPAPASATPPPGARMFNHSRVPAVAAGRVDPAVR